MAQSWTHKWLDQQREAAAAKATRKDQTTMRVRQTACKHCGQDIENFSPYKAGEWRDRGNNTTCPTPEGDAGQEHVPINEKERIR